MPNYFTADNVNLGVKATLDGARLEITSATVKVIDPNDSIRENNTAMTIDADEATFQVLTTDTGVVGIYKVEYTVTLSNSQGVLSAQDTFEVTVRI